MKNIRINFKDGKFIGIKCEEYATEGIYMCLENVLVYNNEKLSKPTFIIYNMDEIREIIVEYEEDN